MTQGLFEARAISCGYGGRAVLTDVSIRIVRGECVGIIGPNGSGKTTLMRAMTRIIPLMSGEMLYSGAAIDTESVRSMARRIAVVSQSQSELSLEMTVADMVSLGRIPHLKGFAWRLSRQDRDAVAHAMDITRIHHLKDRRMACLSGGERQRVILARALAQTPALLLLDEPTAHLDIGYSTEIFATLMRLRKEKDITIACVLHDLNLASVYCDRLYLLHEGCLAAEGAPREVIRSDVLKRVYNADVKIYRGDLSDTPQILF